MRIGWFLAGVLVTLAALAAIGLVVIKTGSYDVAASDRHTPFMRWALGTTFDNAVRREARDLQPPPRFTPAMIAEGAREFKESCQACHGGVGVGPISAAHGMLPEPPDLTEEARELSTAEVYWIVDHGVKMTGMPSFGATHDSKTIWNIAGFVKQLPGMSAAQDAAYEAEHGGEKSGRGEQGQAG